MSSPTSKKRKATTLLERHGFKDQDAGTPTHDAICVWLDKNMATVAVALFPEWTGDVVVKSKVWEKPLVKNSYGGYPNRHISSAVIGFADIAVEFKCCSSETLRYRKIDDDIREWVHDPDAFFNEPTILRVGAKDDEQFVTYQGDQYERNFERLKSDAAEDRTITYRAPVRQKAPLADDDVVRTRKFHSCANVIFEVKSKIPSLGDMLRELQFYKQHADPRTKLVVVCNDDTHAGAIRSQGFMFYQCPDLATTAKGIKSFFSSNAKPPASRQGYVLEVVRFSNDAGSLSDQQKYNGGYTHVGYMDAHFRTVNNACSYYSRHNPHMRAITAHGNLRSDWDPETHLAYIIRHDMDMHASVAPFDPADASKLTANECEFKWLL